MHLNAVLKRYDNNLMNFFNIFIDIVTEWTLIDNSEIDTVLIAERVNGMLNIKYPIIWDQFKNHCYEK
jgi:predicted ABC-type ATPase